jgi:hypothetical protein
MILDVLAIYFLVQCVKMLARLIKRRHDVLYYVNPG